MNIKSHKVFNEKFVLNEARFPYEQKICFMAEYFLPDVDKIRREVLRIWVPYFRVKGLCGFICVGMGRNDSKASSICGRYK